MKIGSSRSTETNNGFGMAFGSAAPGKVRCIYETAAPASTLSLISFLLAASLRSAAASPLSIQSIAQQI
jgi:hypothetical protein